MSAWTYAGNGETKKALDLLDKLHDPSFEIFRDYHEALIADVGNDAADAEKAYRGRL